MKDVIVVENFLTEDECRYYRDLTDASFKRPGLQLIAKRPDISQKFFSDHYEELSKVLLDNQHITGIHDDVTFARSNKAIPRHIDKKIHNDKWKLLIYLNQLDKGGGTIFYSDMKEKSGYKVENKMGSAVFFNIALPHQGESLYNKLKYSIGFRLII